MNIFDVKIFFISDYVVDFAHLQQVLDFFFHKILRHVDYHLELALIGRIVHLNDKALQTREMLVVQKLRYQHLPVIEVDEGPTYYSLSTGDLEVYHQ